MRYLGRVALGIVVAAVVAGLGCSGESEADRAASVAEAEALAESMLLAVGDLPPGDWVVEEVEEENFVSPTPDPSEWPEECGPVPTEAWFEDGLLAMRARGFVAEGANDANGRGDSSIGTFVMVFESEEQLEGLIEDRDEEAERLEEAECKAALEARSAARSYQSVDEEPHYALADAEGRRFSTTDPLTGSIEVTLEIHSFARGRVMAMYMITESDESPREIDHQGLLEAFEARVVAAQE